MLEIFQRTRRSGRTNVMANNIKCKICGEKIPFGSVLRAVVSGLRPVSTSGCPVIRREPMPSAEITSYKPSKPNSFRVADIHDKSVSRGQKLS